MNIFCEFPIGITKNISAKYQSQIGFEIVDGDVIKNRFLIPNRQLELFACKGGRGGIKDFFVGEIRKMV